MERISCAMVSPQILLSPKKRPRPRVKALHGATIAVDLFLPVASRCTALSSGPVRRVSSGCRGGVRCRACLTDAFNQLGPVTEPCPLSDAAQYGQLGPSRGWLTRSLESDVSVQSASDHLREAFGTAHSFAIQALRHRAIRGVVKAGASRKTACTRFGLSGMKYCSYRNI